MFFLFFRLHLIFSSTNKFSGNKRTFFLDSVLETMSLSKPKRATWTEDNLAEAVRAVSRGLSTYKASSQYGIPRRTLRNHVASGNVQKHLGRHTILGKDEERDFVKRIIKFAELGIPMTPKMIRVQAFAFCEKFNIKHNFNKNTGRAGKGWLRLFLKRNPELAKRKAQMLNPARAQKLNKPIVAAHFREVQKLYEELDLLDHPEKIYNMDEKGCRLTLHRQPTVIAQKGAKRVHLQASEHGENVTVVGCANALGNAVPPLILFKGKRKKPEFEANLPAGAAVLMAPKASMTTELFIAFIKHLAKFKPFGKCLLIFDGAKCHLDFRIAEEAEKHDIVLYCLPSNTTHELQPLDKACYKPFETYWDQEVLQFLQATRAKNLKKDDFNKILTRVWEKSMTHANITSGFRATGLYPLDPSVIPETAFAPSILTNRASAPPTNDDIPEHSPRALPVFFADRETEKSTDTIAHSDNSSRQSSPIATLQQLQNLISETENLPTSPVTPDLHFIRDFSSLGQHTPPHVKIDNQDYTKDLPGPSGMGNTKRLVEYSDSDRSSEAEIMCDFLNRPLPPKRFRIYSSTDSENNFENINPKVDTAEEEDNVPLAKFSTKSPFQTFLPTPDYGHIKTRPRKKALNFKGQRVTKDLFDLQKTKDTDKKNNKDKPKKKSKTGSENNSTEVCKKGKAVREAKGEKSTKGKITNKTIDRNTKKRGHNSKSTTESWYCHACHEDRQADMRPCTDCSKWYHEDCIGLTKNDLDPFFCPNCDKN